MAAVATLLSCAPKPDPAVDLARMEDAFRTLVWEKGEGPDVIAKAIELRNALTAFADRHPDHPESPVYLHNAATIDADFLGEPARAADLFARVADRYPAHELAERCRFLQGFTLAEEVGDIEAAKAAYARFLVEFPDSDLAESARYEINNLGKPLPQLP